MQPAPSQKAKPTDAAIHGARIYLMNDNRILIKRAMCMAIAFLLCVNSSLWAQKEIPAESDAEGAKIAQTAQFKEFIDKYIAKVNAKDRKALRALYDPVSQAAMAKDVKGASQILDAAVDEKIPAKHEVVVSMIGPKEPLMFQEFGAVYAVRPTALVQINSSTESGDTFSSSGAMIFVALSGGKWHEVWANPPDEKKMEAAMKKDVDDEQQKEKSVKASGVTDYHYEPNPPDSFTKLYNWVVRMTAADSKKDRYEIVQIDQPDGGAAETKVIVGQSRSAGRTWMDVLRPNDNGFLGFKLGIGDKPDIALTNGVFREPFQFNGLGIGTFWTDSIFLQGTVLGEVVPTDKGATLVDGTLRLIRFNTTDEKGRKFVTDVVLRVEKKEQISGERVASNGNKVAAGVAASACSWAPSECSNPLMLPSGYHACANGPGKYRVMRDGDESFGSIFISFQAKGTMDPETVSGSRDAPMKIKGRQFYWRVYSTEADGKPIIRKEVLMPNFLPRHKDGDLADYIWVRVDAPTQQGINTLAPVAHGIIRDSL